MFKKIVSIAVALCILMSCVAIGTFSTQAATSPSGVDYGLVENPQYGNILHCWNWSFNNIKNNLKKIAEQGFSAIQTSPIQQSKESTTEYYSTYEKCWWSYYQPIGLNIETNSWNALGTKTEFTAMCTEAHKYGVMVIVDTVFNHLANDMTAGTVNNQVISDLRDDSNAWHQPMNYQISNYSNRYDVTHYSLNGLPDLNTGDSKVQYYATEFLKECIDCGADGFRFDAAKHIETPSDAYGTGSDFWPNVINAATSYAQSTRGFTPYYYGEILDGLSGLGISAYTQYMSVTESDGSRNIREGITNRNASQAAISTSNLGAAMDKTMYWVESHDNYASDSGYTRTIGDDYINRAWAVIGSKNQAGALYLARPSDWTTTKLGAADVTAWANSEVQAVNQFRNYFAGQDEYISTAGSIVYNERGTTGVVLVNVNGGATSVSVPAKKMYNGTYKDVITGNTFTVSNGYIYGDIGNTGIAVVYNEPPKSSVTPGTSSYRTDTLTLTLHCSNAAYGRYSFDDYNYTNFADGDQITIGKNVAVGEKTTVYVQAVNDQGVYSNLQNYTFTKMDPDEEVEIYFDNAMFGWPYTYAYIYNHEGEAAAWPGTQMTYDDNTDFVKVTVPVGFESGNVIFNNNNDAQTPAAGSAGYQLNATTCLFQGGTLNDFAPVKTEGISGNIYLKTSEWGTGDAILKAYVWSAEGSGMVTLSDLGSGLYGGKLPDGKYKHVAFFRIDPNGTGATDWDNIWTRSANQLIPTGQNLFTLNSGEWDNAGGTWSTYTGSAVIPTESTEAVERTCYLAGSFNDWSETATQMTVSNEAATITMDLAAGEYEFKLIDTGVWYGSEYTITNETSSTGIAFTKTAGNATLNAIGGTYTFTYDLSTRRLVVSCEAADTTAPTTKATEPTTKATEPTTESVAPTTQPTTAEPTTEPTESTTEAIVTDYYLAGSFNGWDTKATPMVVSNGVATATVTLEVGAYEFKVVDNGNWYGYNSTIYDVTESNGVSMNSYAGNAKMNANGGTYKFVYDTSTKKLVVSLVTEETEPTEPIITNYYLAGSFNGWSTTDTPMAVTDGVATAKVTLTAGTYEFKVVDNGNWYGYSTAISNKTNTSGVTMKNSDGNAVLYASGGTYTFKYTASSNKLVISWTSGSGNDYIIDGTDPDNTNPSDSEVIVTKPNEDCGNKHSYNKGKVTKKATYFAKGKKVLACKECGATKTVKVAKLKLKKPTVTVKGGTKSVTVKYSKVKGAAGFQVKGIAGGKSFTKTFKTKKAAVRAVNKLSAGTYKVRVRAFVKQGKKTAYSDWTKAQKVKVN